MKIRFAIITIILVALSIEGCSTRPRKRRTDGPVARNAAVIHLESASARADIYDKIADKIEDGELHTVQDTVAFSTPMFLEVGKKYTVDINELRNAYLHDAKNAETDDLPGDAAASFRKIADEYRSLLKTSGKRR